MSRFVIERTLPGAGDLTDDQLRDISTKSNEVLAGLDDVAWVESYVTDDKLYCVYDADDPATIEEHARLGGFPCDSVSEVRSTISPATGR